MVKGLDTFKKYFADYQEQYVLIGGAACDLLFESNSVPFRSTRDLDVVLIIDALTPEFGEKLWEFIQEGQYRNKSTNEEKNQFYRFDKPVDESYPKMIELFSRNNFELHELAGLTPIHIDDTVSSLSAILLNDEYYTLLLSGRTNINEVSVLRPEYLILFKAKAYLDLKQRKDNGESVDSKNIRKHKNDILKLIAEIKLEPVRDLSINIKNDIKNFIDFLELDPYDNSIKDYGLKTEDIISELNRIFNL